MKKELYRVMWTINRWPTERFFETEDARDVYADKVDAAISILKPIDYHVSRDKVTIETDG